MKLSQEQKGQLAAWVSEGEGLSGIQARLQNDLGINMTFMEVRFMIDDLELELQEKQAEPEPTDAQARTSSTAATEILDENATIPFSQVADELEAPRDVMSPKIGGDVSVSVDKLQRPGVVVSGNVTFSDGISAEWQIDQIGQLRLIPRQEGYQPSTEDIEKFQDALQQQLQKRGV